MMVVRPRPGVRLPPCGFFSFPGDYRGGPDLVAWCCCCYCRSPCCEGEVLCKTEGEGRLMFVGRQDKPRACLYLAWGSRLQRFCFARLLPGTWCSSTFRGHMTGARHGREGQLLNQTKDTPETP